MSHEKIMFRTLSVFLILDLVVMIRLYSISNFIKVYTYMNIFYCMWIMSQGFPGRIVVKSLPASVGDTRDMGSISGLGRSPRVGNGKLFQNSCLGNPIDRGSCGLQSMVSEEHTKSEGGEVVNKNIKAVDSSMWLI